MCKGPGAGRGGRHARLSREEGGGPCAERRGGRAGRGSRDAWTARSAGGSPGPPPVVRGSPGSCAAGPGAVSPSPRGRLKFPDPFTPGSAVAGPGWEAQDAADPARHGQRFAPRARGHRAPRPRAPAPGVPHAAGARQPHGQDRGLHQRPRALCQDRRGLRHCAHRGEVGPQAPPGTHLHASRKAGRDLVGGVPTSAEDPTQASGRRRGWWVGISSVGRVRKRPNSIAHTGYRCSSVRAVTRCWEGGGFKLRSKLEGRPGLHETLKTSLLIS